MAADTRALRWIVVSLLAVFVLGRIAGSTALCVMAGLLLVALGASAVYRWLYVGRGPSDLHPSLRAVFQVVSGRDRRLDDALVSLGVFGLDGRGRLLRPTRLEATVTEAVDVVVFAPRQGGVGQWLRAADELGHLFGNSRLNFHADSGLVAISLNHSPIPDPLAEPMILDAVPAMAAEWSVPIGVSATGDVIGLVLRDRAGVICGGQPGSGKTSGLQSLLSPLMRCSSVAFAVVDGKGGGDWLCYSERSFAYISTTDDLASVESLLVSLEAERSRRAEALPKLRGHSSFWDDPVDERLPLIVLVIDESQAFLDPAYLTTKEDKAIGQRIAGLVKRLVALGRSSGIITILATQRPTYDSIPVAARDNCNVRLCWAVSTHESARAVLGDRPDTLETAPSPLGQPQGVFVAYFGAGELLRLRAPFVPPRVIAQLASETACLVRDPRHGRAVDQDRRTE